MKITCKIPAAILVVFYSRLAVSSGLVYTVNRPPAIRIQSPIDVYYKPQERVKMPCVASGIPPPVYRWKKNGIDYSPNNQDDRAVQLPNSGTIIIYRPEDRDEGSYQCFADNGYGVSVSIKTNLRQAMLALFDQTGSTNHRMIAGGPMTLSCYPPRSVPWASVFWVVKEPDGSWNAINFSKRVSMDLEGRLRFTNVIVADEQGGNAYACVAFNSKLRRTAVGPEHTIEVIGTTEQMSPAVAYWTPPSYLMALKGQELLLKCIFSGNPTPDVTWRKINWTLPDRAQLQSFDQELEITNVHASDEGIYECKGHNYETTLPETKLFHVLVEAAPYWTDEPQNARLGVNDKATFICKAAGHPDPVYHWYINGVPIQDVTDQRIAGNPRVIQTTNNFTMLGLTTHDRMNIQCNASNIHGYVFADVYLNVLDNSGGSGGAIYPILG